jgi:hypothetical protein
MAKPNGLVLDELAGPGSPEGGVKLAPLIGAATLGRPGTNRLDPSSGSQRVTCGNVLGRSIRTSARGLVPGVLFSDLGGRAGTADWRVRRVHQTSLVVREWRDSERA